MIGMQFEDRAKQLIENVSGTLDIAISGLDGLAGDTTARVPLQASTQYANAIADRMLDECKLGDIRQRLARQFGRHSAPQHLSAAPGSSSADAHDSRIELF